jgi:hypothetical protein
MRSLLALVAGASFALAGAAFAQSSNPVKVTVGNFIRAETDFYFKTRPFGKLGHSREIVGGSSRVQDTAGRVLQR